MERLAAGWVLPGGFSFVLIVIVIVILISELVPLRETGGSRRSRTREEEKDEKENEGRSRASQELHHSLGARLNVQLFVDSVQVCAHGAECDSKLVGNFLV